MTNMNTERPEVLDEKFIVIQNDQKEVERIRSYDVSFQFSAFRTHEHLHYQETNVATLKLTYMPRRKLVEFESLRNYIESFSEKQCTLEHASWLIIDKIFTELEPVYCEVLIGCELNDSIHVLVSSKRGWRKAVDFGLPLLDTALA